jgi:flagellar motor switch protein FliN/FliY
MANDNSVNLDLIMDVELPISVRFGQTSMLLEDILKLGHGSVIELEKLAEEPVDLLVNGKMLAKGEVVVADGHYAIRITQVESPAERIRSLAE